MPRRKGNEKSPEQKIPGLKNIEPGANALMVPVAFDFPAGPWYDKKFPTDRDRVWRGADAVFWVKRKMGGLERKTYRAERCLSHAHRLLEKAPKIGAPVIGKRGVT